ncbi:spore gernimation protein [Bacillaceae bacterium Marseille-Q3522]|nr:spore gernimation protein [Bacillaceae bacterium Marseille-Q3522]
MNQDVTAYLQRLYAIIDTQEKRIRSLEKKLQQLEKNYQTILERRPVHIDKIEYSFDQLKIETLDGTLNIGINPSDLNNFDEFLVDQKNMKVPFSPKDHFQATMDVEKQLYPYLETELPGIIRETEEKLQVKVDDSYIDFIKEDIKKQLPMRIEHYLKQKQKTERNQDTDPIKQTEQIAAIIKKEIENGVHAFISNLPENKKGRKKE